MLSIKQLLNPELASSFGTTPSSLHSESYLTPSSNTSPTSIGSHQHFISPPRYMTAMDSTTSPPQWQPFEYLVADPSLSAAQQNDLQTQHERFQVSQNGNQRDWIANHTRVIPYNSDKKEFSKHTGRREFRVYAYDFKVPGDADTRTVMWDHDLGLVRITPFFKALKHSKTIPKKAIEINPGLIKISYNITGGATAAQGYWVPFASARALCLTFCHEIRYALTPIFGPSFVNECLPPHHEGFEKYNVDDQIIRGDIQRAQQLAAFATASKPTQQPQDTPSHRSRDRDTRSAERSNRGVKSAPTAAAPEPATPRRRKRQDTPTAAPARIQRRQFITLVKAPAAESTQSSVNETPPVSPKTLPGGYKVPYVDGQERSGVVDPPTPPESRAVDEDAATDVSDISPQAREAAEILLSIFKNGRGS